MICPECKTAIPKEKLFTCLSCSIHSHIECNSYPENDLKQFQITNCDVCRKGEKKKVKCELCRKSNGLFKVFEYKSKALWGHVNCMKWFPKIMYSFSNGFIVYKLDDKLPPETWISDCYLCKKSSTDFLIKCNRKECTLHAHPKCILTKKLEEFHNEQYQFYTFHCDEHKKKKESGVNPLNALKTYGLGINVPEAFNSNITIQINKDTLGIKQENKDIILYSVEGSKNNRKDNEIKNNTVMKSMNSNGDKINNLIKHKNISENDKYDGEEIDIASISTSIRCEYCFENMSEDDDNYNNEQKKCNGCLSWYHIKCEADFFSQTNGYHIKHIKMSQCYKCFLINKYNITPPFMSQRCLVCNHIGGILLPCNKTWVHYICLKSLDIYFYIKNEIRKEYGIDPYKHHKAKESCSICEIASSYILKCPKCSLTFHPYCGFKANFIITTEVGNSIHFQCCNFHKMYLKNYNKYHLSMLKKEKSKQKEQNDSAYSFNSINTSVTSKNKKLVKVNIKRKIFYKDSKKPSIIVKEIGSFNYRYQQRKLIKSGLINPYQISKCDLFNWSLTEPYFITCNNDELNKIFPDRIEANIDEEKDESHNESDIYKNDIQMSNENNYNDEDDDNNEATYSLFQISNNNKQLFLLYKNGNVNNNNSSNKHFTKPTSLITSPDINDTLFNQPTPLNSPLTKFLSKKRNLESQFTSFLKESNNNLNSFATPKKNKLLFKRGFKLNSLSKRILFLESQVMFSKQALSNSKVSDEKKSRYILNEISIKKGMLKETIKQNQSLISLLKSNINQDIKYEQNIQIKKQFKSLFNYQMTSRLLKKGMLPKTFDEILSIKSLNTNMASKSISNKKILIENQFKNDSECCICFTIEPEDASPIVFCDKCNVSFHQTCYGIINIPEGEYLCDLCVSNQSLYQTIHCCLCNNAKGAMKQIDSELWGHVTCILLSDCFVFNDYIEMKNITPFVSSLSIPKPKLICHICNSYNGEVKQCNCCGMSYHFLCAYFEGYLILIEDKIDPHLNNKKLAFQIAKCKNNIEWNLNTLQDQCIIRRLIYQKDLVKE